MLACNDVGLPIFAASSDPLYLPPHDDEQDARAAMRNYERLRIQPDRHAAYGTSEGEPEWQLQP